MWFFSVVLGFPCYSAVLLFPATTPRGEEDGVITVGVDAAGDESAGRLLDAQALCGDGDAAIGGDAGL